MTLVTISHDAKKFRVNDTGAPVMPVAMWAGDVLICMEYVDALKLASELRIACGAEEPKPNTEVA